MRNLRPREFSAWPSSLPLPRCLLAAFACSSGSEGLWYVLRASHAENPVLTTILTMARHHADAFTITESPNPAWRVTWRPVYPGGGWQRWPYSVGGWTRVVLGSLLAAHPQESFPSWFLFDLFLHLCISATHFIINDRQLFIVTFTCVCGLGAHPGSDCLFGAHGHGAWLS